MRRLLLHVLAIAVFLNAAVGLPLHAAVHLVSGGTALAHAAGAAEAGSPGDGDEHDDRIHAPCAWCLAHAESSGAPPAVPGAGRLGTWQEPPAAPATIAPPVFSAGLWAAAPRGPPGA
jgi:hypothetical protein